MKLLKLMLWFFICIFWSPFEVTHIFFHPNKKVSKIGIYLDKKIKNYA